MEIVNKERHNINNYISVSYTHLDVYKRQVETYEWSKNIGWKTVMLRFLGRIVFLADNE